MAARTKLYFGFWRKLTPRASIPLNTLRGCWRRRRRFPDLAIAYITLKIRVRRIFAPCRAILGSASGQPKWYEMSQKIEEFVKADKKLNANVDFYSASTYHTLGIDVDLFTPIFAVSRVSGWAAHVIEQLDDNRLIRPRAEYLGPEYPNQYVPIDQR